MRWTIAANFFELGAVFLAWNNLWRVMVEQHSAYPICAGRVPIHQGQGAGLSNRALGAKSGVESVVLTPNQMPSHNHSVIASSDPGNSAKAENTILASGTNIFMHRETTRICRRQ